MRLLGATTTILLALGASAIAGHSHHAFRHKPAISYAVIANHHDVHDHLGGHKDRHVKHYLVHEDHDKHYHVHEEPNEGDEHADHHSHAKYEFKYGVNNPKTGDIKDHWESRDGDKVRGAYSLKESDGTTRVVNYSADKDKGFEAVVQKIGNARQGLHTHVDYKLHGHQLNDWGY